MQYYTATVENLKRIKAFYRENPDGLVPMNWHTNYNREEFNRFFVSCLNAKINREEKKRGRKDCREWFTEIRRAAHEINSRRIIRWLPADLKKRFAARIYTTDDY